METLRKILRRLPTDGYVRRALLMLAAGEMPPADLLRRCGIRTATVIV